MFKSGDEVEITDDSLSYIGINKGCKGKVVGIAGKDAWFVQVKFEINVRNNSYACLVNSLKKVSE